MDERLKIIQEKIREKAKDLLSKKEVDLVIGFRNWTLPLRTTPVFIRSAEGTESLVWNSFCENNLATYLHKFSRFRVGIVVKGCDARSITALSLEKRFNPERLFLIGVPCQRMVDRRKVAKAVQGEILRAEETEEELFVEGNDFKTVLKKRDFFYPSCQVCTHPTPLQAHFLVDEPVEEPPLVKIHPGVEEFEKKPPEERWNFFARETGRCLRCYACREVCPMCYCTECFVDSSRPKWMEGGLTPHDLQFYHIVRAYHQTGRCSGCGACERACPMDIPITYLTQKLNQDVKELFGFEAGLDSETPPPLSTFEVEDKGDFIK